MWAPEISAGARLSGPLWPAHHGNRGASAPAIGLSRKWEIVSEKLICPHCGNIVEVPGRTDDAIQAVVDSMAREIRLLRETVAQLRGVRAG